MRIAVIGGRYKNEAQLARIAESRGYELEFEEGHTAGRGMEGIRKAVSRSALVVIVTDVNSHGAVHTAKKAARQLDRPEFRRSAPVPAAGGAGDSAAELCRELG